MRKPSKSQKKGLAKSKKIVGSKKSSAKKISKPPKKKGLTAKLRKKTSLNKANPPGKALVRQESLCSTS